MPAKLRSSDAVPTAIAHRLSTWGRSIRAQRVAQRITAADLCARMNISEATLRRIEQGDPGASASTYLTALWVLGMFEAAAPALDAKYWQAVDPHARARSSASDHEYF
ncbi:helix-turn-helix transcriptional regulator [Achromobacter sp. Marseille-Q0513]|uniref:helix-turn-helix domain-containing protein n=1 Tax=Achromobacter sp. Marseille-Q0513 TaxID=2829161 RepID=UPI001B949022|nr:helix-turn-helix transcriptional regulator [Achromobacter sp. Marseille-Q0513]